MTSGEHRRRVLIADDDPDTAHSLSLLFELEGFAVSVCTKSMDVLTAALEFRPDLILLDLDFGVQPTGLDLAGLLREQPRLRRTVLAAVTGWSRETDRAAAMAAGFDRFYLKPVDPAELVQLAGSIERRKNRHDEWPRVTERRRQAAVSDRASGAPPARID